MNSLVPETHRTVGRLLDEAATRLRVAGVADPRREARWIWEGIEGSDSAAAWVDPGRQVAGDVVLRFAEAVGRRAAGEPLAYVTGWAGFRHLTVRCDRRGLIPRPETEGLVDLVLARVAGGVVVDVGTGTGCLALALRSEGSYEHVIGVDRSRDALALAGENVGHSGIEVGLVAGDLLGPVGVGVAHAVVANPPYVTRAEYDELDPGVKDWEPAGALVSGEDGLEATRRLAVEALAVVRAGGWLALELDARRAGETARLAAATGWTEVTIHQDLFGRARYLLARRGEAA
jgi:release factor glutamine methyltransferase